MASAKALHQAVRDRARGTCKYCRVPEHLVHGPFHVDHVVARKHRGATGLHNLAYTCSHCNLAKGTDLTGIDPDHGEVTRLFDPRQQVWAEHFRWDGPVIVGLTSCGRTTIAPLSLNSTARIRLRAALLDEGHHFAA